MRGYWGVPRNIVALVWHDMEGYLAGALDRFNGGAAGAHLAVLRNGQVVRLRPFEDVTWHAGTNADPGGGIYGRTDWWRYRCNINPFSIGIELEGFAASGYTAGQVAAVQRIRDYCERVYRIPRVRGPDGISNLGQLPGHWRHAQISANRSDPGPLFADGWLGI